MKFLLYVPVLLLLLTCTESGERTLPVTESEPLNEKLQTAPVSWIDLDEVPVNDIHITEEQLLYSTYRDFDPGSDAIQLAHPHRLVAGDEHIYIMSGLDRIVEMTPEGEITGYATRVGSGPGEHDHNTRFIFSNDHNIFLNDSNHGRINVYDRDFSFKEEINILIPDIYLALNNEFIVFNNQQNYGMHTEAPDQGLLKIAPLSNPEDSVATIMPRIVPSGMQPAFYNGVFRSINRHNEIAAAYQPLPWIFLFDDSFNHHHTILLEASFLDTLSIPPLEFSEPRGTDGVGGRLPLTNLYFLDNGDLLIHSPFKGTLHVSPDQNGFYHPEQLYRFHLPEDGEQFNTLILDSFNRDSTGFYAIGGNSVFTWTPEW